LGLETGFWRGSRGCLDHDLGVPEGLEHGFGAGNRGLEGYHREMAKTGKTMVLGLNQGVIQVLGVSLGFS